MAVVIAVEVAAAMVAIPIVVVPAAAAIAFPVSLEEALSVVMRPHPMRSGIRRTGPVASMPFVMVSHWIPIALYPDEVGTGTAGHGVNHTWGWRRPNSDPYGYVCCEDRTCQQHQDNQIYSHEIHLSFDEQTVARS